MIDEPEQAVQDRDSSEEQMELTSEKKAELQKSAEIT